MIDVIPSILEKDFSEIERKLKLVAPYAPWVQIDFADGTLFPNQTFLKIEEFKELTKIASLEAHLMVANPEKYIQPLVAAGFKRLIAQVEAHDPRLFLEEAHFESVEVGLAIDGPTPIEQVEPFLEELDFILIMLAEAGANGLELQSENVEKIRAIRQHYPDLQIAVEQGINDQTAKVVVDAGASRIVSSSYLFQNPENIEQMLKNLREV